MKATRVLLVLLVLSLLMLLVGCGGGHKQTKVPFPKETWSYRLDTASIPSTAVPIYVDDQRAGTANLVNLHHKADFSSSFPTVFALYTSGYLRMKVPMDPDNSFGTSVVLGPAYRDNTNYYHHPMISEIRINGTDENHAVIKISALAKIGDLDVTYMIYLEDASLAGIRCHVKQIVNASVPIKLNVQEQTNHQSFKIVQFSSMYIDSHYHDADKFIYESQDGYREESFSKTGQFLFQSPSGFKGNWFQAKHSDNLSWQGATPTVSISFPDDNIIAECTPQGWVTATADHNDDNVGGWINWDKAPNDIPAGFRREFSYTINAF